MANDRRRNASRDNAAIGDNIFLLRPSGFDGTDRQKLLLAQQLVEKSVKKSCTVNLRRSQCDQSKHPRGDNLAQLQETPVSDSDTFCQSTCRLIANDYRSVRSQSDTVSCVNSEQPRAHVQESENHKSTSERLVEEGKSESLPPKVNSFHLNANSKPFQPRTPFRCAEGTKTDSRKSSGDKILGKTPHLGRTPGQEVDVVVQRTCLRNSRAPDEVGTQHHKKTAVNKQPQYLPNKSANNSVHTPNPRDANKPPSQYSPLFDPAYYACVAFPATAAVPLEHVAPSNNVFHLSQLLTPGYFCTSLQASVNHTPPLPQNKPLAPEAFNRKQLDSAGQKTAKQQYPIQPLQLREPPLQQAETSWHPLKGCVPAALPQTQPKLVIPQTTAPYSYESDRRAVGAPLHHNRTRNNNILPPQHRVPKAQLLL